MFRIVGTFIESKNDSLYLKLGAVNPDFVDTFFTFLYRVWRVSSRISRSFFFRFLRIDTEIHKTFSFLIQISWNLHTVFTKIIPTHIQSSIAVTFFILDLSMFKCGESWNNRTLFCFCFFSIIFFGCCKRDDFLNETKKPFCINVYVMS